LLVPVAERVRWLLESDPPTDFKRQATAFALELAPGELRRGTARSFGCDDNWESVHCRLGFADMSPARDQEYPCEGIAEG
jgi:hypothetical protein